VQLSGGAMNLCCKCRRKPLHNEIVKRTHYVIGIPVSHELTGPIDAHVTRWPNPEKDPLSGMENRHRSMKLRAGERMT
jgi:hypothetical protein